MNSSPDKPASVQVLGWITTLTAAALILVNVFGLQAFNALENFDLGGSALSKMLPDSMRDVLELSKYSRWWNIYGILFFVFLLISGIQFARCRAWGRAALEIACWIGLINAVVETSLSYLIWKRTQDAMGDVLRNLGGGQYGSFDQIGVVSIVLGFLFWVAPCVGMIIYLRAPKIRAAVNLP